MRTSLAGCLMLLVAGCGTPARAPFSSDAIVRGCVLGLSCHAGITSIDDCVDDLISARAQGGITSNYDRFVECAASTSCTSMLSCIVYGNSPTICAAVAGGLVCAGNIAVECENEGIVGATDCTAFGMHCGLGANGRGAACTTGESCTPTSSIQCDGNGVVTCPLGVVTRYDCNKYWPGSVCVPDIGCVQDGPACTSDENKCQGGNLHLYCQGNHEQSVDCAATGGTCMAMNPPGCFVADGCAPSGCVKGMLNVCVANATRTVDCTTLGFSGCSSDGTTCGNS